MLELTPDTTANAARRARDMHQHVSRVTDTELAVTCANDAHPGGHVCRFEQRADGSLWGECVLRSTGELCPAHLGRNVCFHLASGAVLFLALEAMRLAHDPDGAADDPVTFDGALLIKGNARFVGRAVVPGDAFRFVCKRTHKGPEPEPDPDAVLVAPIRRVDRVEKVRGFTI